MLRFIETKGAGDTRPLLDYAQVFVVFNKKQP